MKKCDCGQETIVCLEAVREGYYLSLNCPDCGPIDRLSLKIPDKKTAIAELENLPDTITVEFDGACNLYKKKRNPGGIATFGWRILRQQKLVAYGLGEVARETEYATNNVAEYAALAQALIAIRDLNLEYQALVIKGDSQLVIYQLDADPKTGKKWQCNDEKLKAIKDELEKYLTNNTYFLWQPREFNARADELSQEAYGISIKLSDRWYKRYKIPSSGV